eukprot:8051317-Alexandrium_andersonii.AAC.1
MSASLVGSEMCIRDRHGEVQRAQRPAAARLKIEHVAAALLGNEAAVDACLLYTSDAADDM